MTVAMDPSWDSDFVCLGELSTRFDPIHAAVFLVECSVDFDCLLVGVSDRALQPHPWSLTTRSSSTIVRRASLSTSWMDPKKISWMQWFVWACCCMDEWTVRNWVSECSIPFLFALMGLVFPPGAVPAFLFRFPPSYPFPAVAPNSAHHHHRRGLRVSLHLVQTNCAKVLSLISLSCNPVLGSVDFSTLVELHVNVAVFACGAIPLCRYNGFDREFREVEQNCEYSESESEFDEVCSAPARDPSIFQKERMSSGVTEMQLMF